MDKKKLQDFIQKLQEMATQLNDIDESAEDSSLEDSDVHQTISAQSVNTTTSSSNSDFITIKRSDGTQIGYTENFTLNGGAYITVEVDYLGLIASKGYSINNIQGCRIIFCGKSKRIHAGASIYSLSNNALVESNIGVNNMYGIDIYSLYKKYGTANFKFVANWDEVESLFVYDLTIGVPTITSIFVDTQPTKLKYKVGESFNKSGMIVKARYSNGEEAEYTDYTINPSYHLSRTNKYVTIYANQLGSNIFTGLNIDVNRQSVETECILYDRKRNSEDDDWGLWSQITGSNIAVNGGTTYQLKTLIKIDKSKIDMGTDDRIGIQLMLYKKTGGSSSGPVRHFRINNMRYAFNPYYANQIFYVGDVKANEEGYFEIFLEYDDEYFEFKLNNDSDNIATIYFTHSNDPQAKKEVEVIPTAAGEFRLNLMSGSYTYELTDIEPESTPLGVKVSHVFASNEGGMGCGDYCRLNIMEHIDFESVEYNQFIQTHTYTDGYGNRCVFDVVFYYINSSGTRTYIVDSEIENINVSYIDNVPLSYSYNGNNVFIEHVWPNDHVYIKTPSSYVLDNSYYKSLLSNSNNKINLPIIWLRCGNLTKGFNYNGDLVFIIDEYCNYTAISYDANNRVISIKDKDNNYINFNYSTDDKLISIVDSRNRKIKYTYSDDNTITSSIAGSRLTRVQYCHVEDDDSTEEVYKTINIGYIKNTINGLPGYGINTISTSDKLSSSIAYDSDDYNSKISFISNSSTVDNIPSGTGNGAIISKYDMSYNFSTNTTTITDIDGNQAVYKFDENCNLCLSYKIKNNKVSEYKKYEYTKYFKYVIKNAKRSLLNKYSLDNFSFTEGDSQSSSLNFINKKTTSTAIKYTDNAKIVNDTVFSYDNNYRCNIETTTVGYYNLTTGALLHKEKSVTHYIYDSTKRVRKKEIVHYSHFEDNTEIKDKSYVTEYKYDANGNLTKQISYSGEWTTHGALSTCTCDFSTSDKFYTQYAYDSSGRITQSRTQDGLYYDTFEYYDGTQNVQLISHQGRDDVYYAYDGEDNLTKVSSTAEGTENCSITSYALGETVKLNHSGNRPIEFEYESKRRLSKIKLNGSNYISFVYDDKVKEGAYTVDKVTATNANNEVMMTVADRAGSFVKLYYNSSLLLNRTYDCNGYITKVQDSLVNSTENFTRDIDGNIKTYSYVNGGESYSQSITYDFKGNVSQVIHSGTVDRVDKYYYIEDCDNQLEKIITGPNSDITVLPEWDISKRYIGATSKISDLQLTESLTYYKQGDHATNLPKTYSYNIKNGSTVKSSGQIVVSYDESENIKSMTCGSDVVNYEYDSLGRLEKEVNEQLGQTYIFTYDNNGNILTKKIGNITINYAYDGDKLVSYNGQACVYDAVGNPTTYRGKAATWVRGRKLISFNGNTFTYDASGRRLSKNNIKFYYDSNGNLLKQSNGLEFYYDVNGVVGIKYGGITYLCRKDLQGNIIALIDNNGNTVVEYKYDAWGNHKVVDANGNEVTSSNHLGNLNPFRYRGYYYDVETGLYFLKSRYYDPEVGRFLNMDSIEYTDPESVNGLNLYAYCGDNPVKNIDPYGNNFWGDVGNWFANTGNSIKNWFVDVGNSVKDFFVEDVYGIVIKPAVDWVIGIAAPAISNFFTSTVPDFFVNTIWNNGLVPAWNATGKFFTNTIPNFFVNTFWNDWIVDKTWNQFIVGTVWNKGLVPAWNWVLNNCQDLIDGISGVFSIGSGVVGILSAVGVVSIPVAGQIILGTASIGFGIYSIGRILKWW